MICTPFTGHPVKGVIFMRYNYEFKRKAVEMYRQGKWIEAPSGTKNIKAFHDEIVKWKHLEDVHGPEANKRKGTNKIWSPEEKLALVSMVLAGSSFGTVSYEAGINKGMLYKWVRNYKIWGYNGLIDQKKGRKPKDSQMKKMTISNPRKLNESEYEELLRLRAEVAYIKAENEYIKAENEVIKKEIALREEKQAALLKAKRQRLSKNSEKKDSD